MYLFHVSTLHPRFTGTEKRGDIEPNQALRQAEERGGGRLARIASNCGCVGEVLKPNGKGKKVLAASAKGPDDEPGPLVAETCKRCNLLPVSRRKVYSSPGYHYQETESAVMGDPEAKGPRPGEQRYLADPAKQPAVPYVRAACQNSRRRRQRAVPQHPQPPEFNLERPTTPGRPRFTLRVTFPRFLT